MRRSEDILCELVLFLPALVTGPELRSSVLGGKWLALPPEPSLEDVYRKSELLFRAMTLQPSPSFP